MVNKRILLSLCGQLKAMEKLEVEWIPVVAKNTVKELNSVIPLMTLKKQKPLKEMMQHLVLTLSGIIEGRKEKILTKKQARACIAKIVDKSQTLCTKIVELDLPSVEENYTKPVITIRPGYDNVSKEAQDRLQDSILDETGKVRVGFQIEDEIRSLSPVERDWEETEAHRIKKEKSIKNWEQEFFGELEIALDQYKKQIDKLPRISNKLAMLVKGPVIPTTKVDTLLRVNRLKVLGITVNYVGGCSIFEDQILLAINTDKIQDEMIKVDNYKSVARDYNEKLYWLRNKLQPIKDMEELIADYEAEIKDYEDIPPNAYGPDLEKALSARELRTTYLTKQIKILKLKIEKKKIDLAQVYSDLADMEEKVSEHKAKGKKELNCKLTDYTPKVLELANKCLDKINLTIENKYDKLVLVSDKGIVHGHLTYYWVMQDKLLGAWNAEIAFSKIKFNIFDWSFPTRRISRSMFNFESNLRLHEELVNYVHRLKEKEYTQPVLMHKCKKFLKARRKKLSDYEDIILKVWNEANVIKEEKERSKIHKPNITLLSKLKSTSK
jgi:hypothetical protein